LEHDIDTGDAASIRQPPRHPPLASATAEDDLTTEMLTAGVIDAHHQTVGLSLWFNFDIAVYTALVSATDCNISLLPARPYFLPNIQDGRQ